MMVKYYTVGKYPSRIELLEVIRETPQCVVLPKTEWTRERRESKHSDYSHYWETWGEAHEHLSALAEKRLDAAKKELRAAEDYSVSVGNMKKGEPADD